MNACTFCKHAKRKCSKTRPSCSNCVRLHRDCVYSEDSIQTFVVADAGVKKPPRELSSLELHGSWPVIDPLGQQTLQQSMVDTTLQVLGSFDNMLAISAEFFVGSHQRIPTLSRFRFHENLQSATVRSPSADFAALCLCMVLVQQMPSEITNVQSPLYVTIKNMINTLEMTNTISLDLLHCRLLIAFYEMGHGLHTAAYLSVAACARIARVLGFHKKAWRNIDPGSDWLGLEEEKRAWWAIVIMDRFISLYNGDSLFVTEDPERADSLPIDDLLWSEGSSPAALEGAIASPPTLDTPVNVSVGQMARECQISHLVGRVVRHVFNPTPDPDFNTEEGIQLERTLKAYLPMLAQEELSNGRYCAAFGMCNRLVIVLLLCGDAYDHSALYILYEFMLSRGNENIDARRRVLQCMEETSFGAITFSSMSYLDREGNYPAATSTPYLPYSLCQATVIQYRLWRHTNDPSYKRHIETLKDILNKCAKRWVVAEEYLKIIQSFDENWPTIALPFQGSSLVSRDKYKTI